MPSPRIYTLEVANKVNVVELLKKPVDTKEMGFSEAAIMLLRHHGAETIAQACQIARKRLNNGPVAHPERVAEGIERRLKDKGLPVGVRFADDLNAVLAVPKDTRAPPEPPPAAPEHPRPRTASEIKLDRTPPEVPKVEGSEFDTLVHKLAERRAARDVQIRQLTEQIRQLEDANAADAQAIVSIEEARKAVLGT